MIIIFREVLEMSLVLGVLLAATNACPKSRRYIAAGALAGFLGAGLVAWFMEELEGAVNGDGEFLFNACLLGLASLTIAWTVIWMSQHGRKAASKMRRVGECVTDGDLPEMALAMAAFAAVIREGGEAVLFLAGASQGGQDAYGMILGGLLGLILGASTGLVVFSGLVRIPMRYLFQTIAWFMMLLAAGMASQAASNLVMIDLLPPLVDTVWDSSRWLPQSGVFGELLHAMIGYDEQPNAMQLLVFVVSLILMIGMFRRGQRRPQQSHAQQAAA